MASTDAGFVHTKATGRAVVVMSTLASKAPWKGLAEMSYFRVTSATLPAATVPLLGSAEIQPPMTVFDVGTTCSRTPAKHACQPAPQKPAPSGMTGANQLTSSHDSTVSSQWKQPAPWQWIARLPWGSGIRQSFRHASLPFPAVCSKDTDQAAPHSPPWHCRCCSGRLSGSGSLQRSPRTAPPAAGLQGR